jgi:hypothetical protein
MSNVIPDLWDTCYDGEAQKIISPKDFRDQFCSQCLNAGCRNSRAAGSKWVQRMLTQEDILLNNPRFADPNDPQFAEIRGMDFQDMIRQALAIEVSTRKGDWSVPTDAEIGAAAAEMVGMIPPPSGFKAPEPEPEPEPAEEPQPPERLVDEVETYDLGRELPEGSILAATEPVGTIPPPDVKALMEEPPKLRGQTEEVVMLDDEQGPVEEPEGKWRIRGDSGTIYDVTLWGDGSWECSCPSRENPCKHARDIATKLSRAPAPSTPPEPEKPPQNPTRPTSGPAGFVPRRMNTEAPAGGVMIGGGEPPPPAPEHDPWAPPPTKPKERVIPVGGRVSFKKKG